MDKIVQELQDEVKVLKNEIKETLTDIREHLLTYAENPFATAPVRPASPNGHAVPAAPNNGVPAPTDQSTVVSESIGGGGPVSVPGAEKQPDGATPPEPAKNASVAPAALDGKVDTAAKANGPDGPAPSANEKVDKQEKAVAEEECPGPVGAASERPAVATAKAATRGEVKDLFTVATLAPWMEDSVARLGKERVKAIVEVYASMGGMTNELRDVLLKLVGLDGANGARPNVSLRECMRSLAELDNLLWRSRQDPRGAALYAALLSSKEVMGVPWARE